ncbi:hypothetical protein H920_09655 [Fukomys damarensis]|uniref:Uncharacterized protein n=1 Tax=Fukomys damarensis TaxID=885580 RepID=A0A091DFF2_FUKDA|nr:hypothetical protein H920_09655 [Fukomys damarensis]
MSAVGLVLSVGLALASACGAAARLPPAAFWMSLGGLPMASVFAPLWLFPLLWPSGTCSLSCVQLAPLWPLATGAQHPKSQHLIGRAWIAGCCRGGGEARRPLHSPWQRRQGELTRAALTFRKALGVGKFSQAEDGGADRSGGVGVKSWMALNTAQHNTVPCRNKGKTNSCREMRPSVLIYAIYKGFKKLCSHPVSDGPGHRLLKEPVGRFLRKTFYYKAGGRILPCDKGKSSNLDTRNGVVTILGTVIANSHAIHSIKNEAEWKKPACRPPRCYSSNISVEELLKGRKAHREVIFKYLATQGIGVSPATEKQSYSACNRLLERATKDETEKNARASHKEGGHPTLSTPSKRRQKEAEKADFCCPGEEFCHWFFELLNSQNPSMGPSQDERGAQHFLRDVKLRFYYNTSEQNVIDYHGAEMGAFAVVASRRRVSFFLAPT